MGISKRNPRSNFNWQSRILKKKAQCCGQLPVVDCDGITPVVAVGPDKLCVQDPPVNANITVINTAVPPQLYNNTFSLYKNGVLIGEQTLPFGLACDFPLTPATLADGGLYEAVVTNSAGCSASGSGTVNTYMKPNLSSVSVGSTITCVPPDDPNSPGLGDGEITITVDNPVPGYTYAYTLCYDLGAPIYAVCKTTQTGTFTSYTWTGLCNFRYIIQVGVVIPGGNPAGECLTTVVIDLF